MSQNILFILTDQQRVDTLGAYGNTSVSTPNLDALADEGTRFDQWYTPTAICTPARASLLTGQAPFRHKLLANYERNVGYIEDLERDTFTFSQELRRNNYNVGLVGKWHAGTRLTAEDFGFDSVDLPGWHNPVDHPDYLAYLDERGLPPYVITDEIRGRLPNGERGNLLGARLLQPEEATFEAYLVTRTIERMRAYADDWRRDERPFFLALHFFGPHLPYIVPTEYYDLIDPNEVELPVSVVENFAGKPPVQKNYSKHWAFDTMTPDETKKAIAVYWGYCSMIDHQIGRLFDEARRLGLYDDTTVFFSADHGEFTGAHRLHDKGPAMYDDIYRTPGIIRVPGRGQDRVVDDFVSLLDCTATILDLADCATDEAVDSRSLLPLIDDPETEWPDYMIAEFHGHHFPYPQRMIRTDAYKLIVNPESVNELYDLRRDPHELVNVVDHPEYADTRRELMTRLYRDLRERGDNFYHWMSSMYDVGGLDFDPTQSAFEKE